MGKVNYQRYFWAVLFVALFIDTSFDFIAFNQSHNADVTDDIVIRTYQVIHELSKIEDQTNLASMRSHYRRARDLTLDNSDQQKRLSRISFLDYNDETADGPEIERQMALVRSTVSEARSAEEAAIEKRVEADRWQNTLAKKQVVWASVFDIVLLSLAGFLWVLEDRARRKNEAALDEAIESLHKTNANLEKVLTTKTKQLQTTAHDLKNPLGSIRGFADLITDECNQPASVVEMAQVIQRISRNTLELVSSLVDADGNEVTSRKSRRVPIDVASCVDEVCKSFAPQIRRKSQSIRSSRNDADATIEGDPQQIRDLLTNLIGNSVKFSPHGGSIEVRAERKKNLVRFEIEDDGPGFTDDDKEKAFGQFQKLSARPTGDERSTGLGLYLAKEVVDLHKGRIEIRDARSGRGTLIVIELPARAETTH